MDWDYCKKNFIKKIEKDKEKIESIKKTAVLRLKYIKNTKVDDENSSFIIEGYYEVIKELLAALMLVDGLKSNNHQCLISYFYNKYKDYDAEINLISQMSFLRNRLNYYGEQIETAFYEKNKIEFEKIINLLQKLINEQN